VDDTQGISNQISAALDTAAECATAETARNYGLLNEQLGTIATAAGQLLRSHVAYGPLLAKLRDGERLTPVDVQTLRALIVGDADEVLKYDDEFGQSKTELRRILAEIRKLQSRDLDLEALMRLRVLCREASNTLIETLQYLDKKERIRNFDDHTRGDLTDETRRMLAGIVESLVA
jgi:hypothetical protein